MTIIADPTYLKGDLLKLDNNKYNKRDSDFAGIVFYTTPNGKFVNAWTYQRGKISGKISPNNEPSGPAGTSENTNKIETNLTSTTTCYQWIQTTTFEGHTYPPVVIDSYCVTSYSGSIDTGGGGGGGSAPGGGDNGGGSSTSPGSPDNPCGPKNGAIDNVGKISVNSVTVNQTPPPTGPVDPGSNPGGGFPPPDGNVPCSTVITSTATTVHTPDIIDSLGAKYPCAARLIAALPNLPTAVARLIYQAFDSRTNNNIIFREGNAAYFAANKSEDGYTQTNGTTSRIYINPSILANASNEYQLVTLYHEALHAYLDEQRGTLGVAGFAAKYPAIKVVARPANSSNVTRQYDYYFDEGATMAQVDPKHRTMADYFTQELRDAILAYNPNFPIDRATALARGGIFLNDTSNKYFNDSEKDVRTGNSVGTKCTP